MHAELLERLDRPDLDDEIDDRPVAEIITEICRDLGLTTFPETQPWKRRTPEDIEQICARPAAVAPFVRRPANPAHTAPSHPNRTTPIRDG